MKSFRRVFVPIIFTAVSAFFPVRAFSEEPKWLSPKLGPLSPSAHFRGAVGDSSGDAEELAVGHHDPTREDGTLQAAELGLSLRQNWLEGFAVFALSYGAEEDWESEWEEAFLKIKELPGDVELRGGRMLSRFGKFNTLHPHAWNLVDTPLPSGLFLGDHGLTVDGGDVTWLKMDVDRTFGFTLGYGKALEHHHHHDHDMEEHADHEEEHGNHEEAHEEGEIAFHDGLFTWRGFGQLRPHDYRSYEAGLSLAIGEEEQGRQVVVYGLDFTYLWSEKGLEPGGRKLTWTTEFMYRQIENNVSHEHEGHEDHADEDHAEHADEDHEWAEKLPGGGAWGAYTEAIYSFNRVLDLGGRVGYVQGNDELETENWLRVSPVITAYLDPYRRASLRLQYNFDERETSEDEHTVWLQLGLAWGGSEVR